MSTPRGRSNRPASSLPFTGSYAAPICPAPQTSAFQLSARPTKAGMLGSFGPRNFAATAPIEG